MSATDYLSTLFWGVPSSGVYSAEDTTTLGTDRVDRREPPSAYHWSALQTSRMRQLLALMSAHFKGGSRVRIYPVTANPFSSGEMGTWIDSSASNALKYFNGTTNTTLGAGGGGGTMATTYSAGASQTDSTIGLDSTRLGLRVRDNATPITGDLTAWQNSGGTVTMLGVRRTGISVSSTVETSGTVLPVVRITPAAHTGMTASTEYSILDESGSVTHQFATGALSSQRFHKLFQHTIAFVGASVVTDAANLWLQGAPSAGTNATLTNSWALWVGSGDSLFERNATGATVGTSALTIGQRDAATSGNQKYSPMLRWYGSGYDADNTVSRTWEIGAQAVPVQGNTVTGSLNFYARLDGGSWSSALASIGDNGTVFDSTSAAGTHLFKVAGTNIFQLADNGSSNTITAARTSLLLYTSGSNGLYADGTSSNLTISGGIVLSAASGAVRPGTDLTTTSGQAARRWTENWSRRYAGVEQTIAAAASITINPASGETIRITLGATGITTVNGSAGYAGEVIRVEVIQDAGGSKTISGWSTGTNGFLFAGAAYTATATANSRDVLTFAWDTVATKWVECSRAMDVR